MLPLNHNLLGSKRVSGQPFSVAFLGATYATMRRGVNRNDEPERPAGAGLGLPQRFSKQPLGGCSKKVAATTTCCVQPMQRATACCVPATFPDRLLMETEPGSPPFASGLAARARSAAEISNRCLGGEPAAAKLFCQSGAVSCSAEIWLLLTCSWNQSNLPVEDAVSRRLALLARSRGRRFALRRIRRQANQLANDASALDS